MTTHDLSRDQLIELKQAFICDENDANGEPTYWSDMADADDLVSDATIHDEYAGYDFTDDDFLCTAA